MKLCLSLAGPKTEELVLRDGKLVPKFPHSPRPKGSRPRIQFFDFSQGGVASASMWGEYESTIQSLVTNHLMGLSQQHLEKGR